MYEYGICNVPDEEIFYKQCAAIEKNIQGLEKDEILQDVDSSLIQVYRLDGKEIKVVNSQYIGDIHIKSEIDLLPYFQNQDSIN